jgi:glutamate carboxypeptidase
MRFLLGFFAVISLSAQTAILQAVDAGAADSLALLERLVNINSGTFNPAGVKAVAGVMEAELRGLGFATRMIPMDALGRGGHLVAERKGPGKPVLLIGHMDTVFEPSSPFQKWERRGRTAVGPGTSDMKGGLVVMLSALRALQAAGELEGRAITVFLTGDEEAPGTLPAARADLVLAGKAAKAALGFETGIRNVSQDMVSTARRGFTGWQLKTF